MRTLIRNGTVIDPGNSIDSPGSILIENGNITGVYISDPPPDADRIIDATGLLVCPGFIDPHVAVREPGFVCSDRLKGVAVGTRRVVLVFGFGLG